MPEHNGTLGIERRSIDFIPDNERRGRPRGLFAIWFAANVQITVVVTGALAVLSGLGLGWALLAIVIGNVAGGVFMALHSAQGPRLGIPQMIQSRAQFGYLGAVLPLLFVVLMALGYFATSDVLGGEALTAWTGLNINAAVIVVAVFTGLVTLFGYRVMHGYGRLSSVLCGIVFIYLTVRLLTTSRLGAVFANEHFSASAFLLVISIMATWQITYAPYVADYSRYLPRNVAARATFWWTFAGSVGGTVWLMCFGAIAAAGVGSALENNDVSYVVGLSDHGVAQVVYPILIVGIIATNMLNLYEAFMSTATTLNAVARFRLTPVRRAALICAATIAGTLIAVIGRTNFLNNYSSFLGFLMYFMIPWTAINLIDFYVLRHANYRTEAFFERHGEYGLINVRTMTAFVAAIVLQIPFVNTTFYVGPMAHLFGGADVAWMVGLVVAAVLYYALMAGRVRRSASVGRTSTVLRGTR